MKKTITGIDRLPEVSIFLRKGAWFHWHPHIFGISFRKG